MTPRRMEGEELRYIRVEMAELPLEEMSSRLGVSASDLAEMEAGRKEIPAHFWDRVIDITDDQ